jgi:hypothetical protein
LAQGALVIDPHIDDRTGAAVETEKEPEATGKFDAKPMAIFRAERVALAKIGTVGIGRDHLQHEIEETR